jgi:hypothetical protein
VFVGLGKVVLMVTMLASMVVSTVYSYVVYRSLDRSNRSA